MLLTTNRTQSLNCAAGDSEVASVEPADGSRNHGCAAIGGSDGEQQARRQGAHRCRCTWLARTSSFLLLTPHSRTLGIALGTHPEHPT